MGQTSTNSWDQPNTTSTIAIVETHENTDGDTLVIDDPLESLDRAIPTTEAATEAATNSLVSDRGDVEHVSDTGELNQESECSDHAQDSHDSDSEETITNTTSLLQSSQQDSLAENLET
jgi:hypothetical protein